MAGILFWAEGDAFVFNDVKWRLLSLPHQCNKTAMSSVFGLGLRLSLKKLQKRSTVLACLLGKEEAGLHWAGFSKAESCVGMG